MASSVLVDTNVVSYIFRRDTRAIPYLRQYLDGNLWVASFMTLAELNRWAIRYQWGKKKRDELRSYLANYVIVPFDERLCFKWAEVMDKGRQAGQ